MSAKSRLPIPSLSRDGEGRPQSPFAKGGRSRSARTYRDVTPGIDNLFIIPQVLKTNKKLNRIPCLPQKKKGFDGTDVNNCVDNPAVGTNPLIYAGSGRYLNTIECLKVRRFQCQVEYLIFWYRFG